MGFGLAGAVGGTIGAGILRTPGLVASQLQQGPLILAAWLVGGLYALLGALCVAELATTIPLSGGWSIYMRRAFGDRAGFTVGWLDWLAHCLGVAWVAITAGAYSQALLPWLPSDPRPVALASLLLFGGVQWLGLRAASGSQQLLSLAKALAFLALVAACFLVGGDRINTNLVATAAPSSLTTASSGGNGAGPVLALVAALQSIISTYDGWHSPIYFAEEFERPQQDLPRSLLGGVVAVTTIYLLVNLALLQVLTLSELAGSNLPVADAAALIFGSAGRPVITALALLSVLGLINASLMSGPRVLFALAREGLFAPAMARVHPRGTPLPALLATVVTTGLLVLLGDFTLLLALSAFCYVALYGSGIASLLWLRLRQPQLPRPFRAWGWPLTPLIMLAGSLAFLLATLLEDRQHSAWALLLIAAGWPAQQLSRWLAPVEPAGSPASPAGNSTDSYPQRAN